MKTSVDFLYERQLHLNTALSAGAVYFEAIALSSSPNINRSFALAESYNIYHSKVGNTNRYALPAIPQATNTNPSPLLNSTYPITRIRVPANDYENAKEKSIQLVRDAILDNSACPINTDSAVVGTTIEAYEFTETARTVLDQFIAANKPQQNGAANKITANLYILFLKEISYILSNIRKVNAVSYCKYNAYSQRIEFTFCDHCELPYAPAYNVYDTSVSPDHAHEHNQYLTHLVQFSILQSPLTTNKHSCLSKAKTILRGQNLAADDIPLLFRQSYTSDTPTFDINDDVGTNGVLASFKKITYETYNVFENFDIAEMFNIKEGLPITYALFFSALSFIFEQWRSNLKNINIEVYTCHYNCHGNKVGENTSVTKIDFSDLVGGYLYDENGKPVQIAPTGKAETIPVDDPVNMTYNVTEIMFVLRYRGFTNYPVRFPDNTTKKLGEFSSHEYEKNFILPAFQYYNQAAESVGSGNDVVRAMINNIVMTHTYTMTKTKNPKTKDKPCVIPLTINYPVLNSGVGEDYQFMVNMQISSLNVRYYGDVYGVDHNTAGNYGPNDPKAYSVASTINSWLHHFQFLFLAADDSKFLDVVDEQSMENLRSTVFKATRLSDFACDSIDIESNIALQYTTRDNLTTIYVMNETIIDSLSVHKGVMDTSNLLKNSIGTYEDDNGQSKTTNLYSLLLNSTKTDCSSFEKEMTACNVYWPPTGKTVCTENDGWWPYITNSATKTQYLQQRNTNAARTTYEGVKLLNPEYVAPLSLIWESVNYLKEVARSSDTDESVDGNNSTVLDIISRSLPCGLLLIRPTSVVVAMNPDKYIYANTDNGVLPIEFRGLEYANSIHCYKRIRFNKVNNKYQYTGDDYTIGANRSTFTYRIVATTAGVETLDGNNYELKHDNNFALLPDELDPRTLFSSYISLSAPLTSKDDLDFNIKTSTYNEFEETVILEGFGQAEFDDVLSDNENNIEAVLDQVRPLLNKIDSMRANLESALKEMSNLYLKLNVASGDNLTKFFGSKSIQILLSRRPLGSYTEIPLTISCGNKEVSLGNSVNDFKNNLVANVIRGSALEIINTAKFKFSYGVDYAILTSVLLQRWQEIKDTAAADRPTSIAIIIIPTDDAKSYFEDDTLLTVLLDGLIFT